MTPHGRTAPAPFVPLPGQLFDAPESDYERRIRVLDVRGGLVFARNIQSGRRTTMKLSTLARWRRAPDDDVTPDFRTL